MLQLGKESTVEALGQRWTMGRLELRIIREFRDWIKERLPDPMAIGEKYFALLPPEEQLARVKEAEQIATDLKCFSMQSKLATRFLSTEEGCAKLAQLLLSKHHPDVSEEDALAVFLEAGPQFQAALEKAKGSLPGPVGNGQAPA